MKKIILALLLAGIVPFSADAQNGKSNFNKNYKVCIKDNKYVVCDEVAKMNEQVGRDIKVTSNDRALHMFDTHRHMGYKTADAYSSKNNPRIHVNYEDPNAAYQGEETSINDGVQKNKARNINYLDGSVQLPPNDGGNN